MHVLGQATGKRLVETLHGQSKRTFPQHAFCILSSFDPCCYCTWQWSLSTNNALVHSGSCTTVHGIWGIRFVLAQLGTVWH